MKSQKEKMINGEMYDPQHKELAEDRLRARSLVRSFNDTHEADEEKRAAMLKNMLGSTGDRIHVESTFRCDYGYNIYVGEDFYANFDCTILDAAPVKIGKNCMIAPGVHIYTSTHPLSAEERIKGLESAEAVTIGDNVWIGGRAVINPGVNVGDNVVIASGAVVVKDVPDYVVVGGNPARILKELEEK